MSLAVGLVGDAVSTPVPPFSVTSTVYTPGIKVSVNGTKVITKVVVTFTSAGPTPPSGTTDVVTVTPGTTKLKDNSTNVLRAGDNATGTYGNTVVITPTQTKLKSS